MSILHIFGIASRINTRPSSCNLKPFYRLKSHKGIKIHIRLFRRWDSFYSIKDSSVGKQIIWSFLDSKPPNNYKSLLSLFDHFLISVVGVIMTLLIYEVITHSYMNEKIGTRHRLNSRSNTLKCIYIIDNYNYKS